MKEEVRRALAEIRVEEGKKHLVRHAVVYAVVMALLIVLALFVTKKSLWVVFVALGWGLGLAMHALRCRMAERRLMAHG